MISVTHKRLSKCFELGCWNLELSSFKCCIFVCISSIIIIFPSNCKWGLIRINIYCEGAILI